MGGAGYYAMGGAGCDVMSSSGYYAMGGAGCDAMSVFLGLLDTGFCIGVWPFFNETV